MKIQDKIEKLKNEIFFLVNEFRGREDAENELKIFEKKKFKTKSLSTQQKIVKQRCEFIKYDIKIWFNEEWSLKNKIDYFNDKSNVSVLKLINPEWYKNEKKRLKICEKIIYHNTQLNEFNRQLKYCKNNENNKYNDFEEFLSEDD